MRILKWLAPWVLLAIAFGAMVGGRCWDYFRLKEHGVSTQGIAESAQPHYQIGYFFTVNGHAYRGVGRTGAVSTSSIAIGDTVPVYYLPDTPEVNCMGSPSELYSNDLPLVLLVTFVFPTITVAVLAFRFSNKARGRKEARSG
jgi:hypothetical protein